MAVKTVTNANLSEYVAEQKAKGSQIATGEQVAAVEAKLAPDGKPATGVVGSGAETLAPEIPPADAKPSAQVKAEKEKSDEGKDNPFKERIKELTDRNKELDEFGQGEYEGRIQAQKRISELEAELKRLTPEKPPEELKAPDPKAFTSQAEYDKAVEAYQDAIIDRRVEKKLAYAREQERQVKLQELLDARAQEAGKDIPDFWDVVKRGPSAPVPPPHIQAVLQEWETGVKIAYHLVKHQDEAKKIYAMTPGRAIEALIPLAQKYAKAAQAETKEQPAPPAAPVTTRAPAPMTPIKSTPETVPTDLSGPMGFADYRARRLQQIRQRRADGRK
jgi:hypothetical protein